MSRQDSQPKDLDQAVADRLARLSQSPVDTTRLERRLGAALRNVPIEERSPVIWVLRSWRTVGSVAAALAICATIAVIIFSSRSAIRQYSTAEVVLAHEVFLNASPHLTTVASVYEANCRCEEMWPDAPEIPELADAQIQCCCVHEFIQCRAACLHFEYEGVPVTLAITKNARLDARGVTTLHQAGRQYLVGTHGRFQVLSLSDNGRSLCMISELPQDTLVRLATGIDL